MAVSCCWVRFVAGLPDYFWVVAAGFGVGCGS